MPRCDFCFKDKPSLEPVLPKCTAKVCKGCYYELDKSIGFLLHYGCQVLVQGTLQDVPKRRKSKSGRKKQVSNTSPSDGT